MRLHVQYQCDGFTGTLVKEIHGQYSIEKLRIKERNRGKFAGGRHICKDYPWVMRDGVPRTP